MGYACLQEAKNCLNKHRSILLNYGGKLLGVAEEVIKLIMSIYTVEYTATFSIDLNLSRANAGVHGNTRDHVRATHGATHGIASLRSY